jgi:hypothetical protein
LHRNENDAQAREMGMDDAMSEKSTSIEASSPAAISDDPITVIAAGVLAATLAAVCHETLGHGLGCIVVGGRITLLTSIYFRCLGATALTDAAGPLGSFLAGMAAFAVLSLRSPGRTTRLFLILFGAINLFWLFGQMVYCAALGKDDWAFVALQMGWSWVWRPIAAAIGVAGYALALRQSTAALAKTGAPTRPAIRLAYIAAVASAVIAGLMWRPEPVRSAIEGFLAVGLAPLGLLIAVTRTGRAQAAIAVHLPITRSWWWIAVGVMVFGVFLFTQGLGLGPLAITGLPA